MYEVSAMERNGHKRKGCVRHLLRRQIQKRKEMTERIQKKVDRAIRCFDLAKNFTTT
nr:MAG TPA: MED7 protein [Caudoviricetes sp.]